MKVYSTKIEEEYIETIRKLSDKTRISQVNLIREAFDDLFKKHGIELEPKK